MQSKEKRTKWKMFSSKDKLRGEQEAAVEASNNAVLAGPERNDDSTYGSSEPTSSMRTEGEDSLLKPPTDRNGRSSESSRNDHNGTTTSGEGPTSCEY